MDEEHQSVPDAVLRLPTRRVFLLRRGDRGHKDQHGNTYSHPAGWGLSDKPADVFDLDPGEYFEMELPVVQGDGQQYSGSREDRLLVKPVFDKLDSLAPIAGTVTFRKRHVDEHDYYLPAKVKGKLTGEWSHSVKVDAVNDETTNLADELKAPAWRDSWPSPESAASIAAAVQKAGGRLGMLSNLHPTDGCYRKIVDALEPYGVCIQGGDFIYDPPLATKRAKGRRSRDRTIATADDREQAKRDEAKRADEEELKTLNHQCFVGFLATLSQELFTAALRGVLQRPTDPEDDACVSMHACSEHLSGKVVEAFMLWEHTGRSPTVYEEIPLIIGGHDARPLPVLHTLVDRLTVHAARIRKRAKAAKMKPKLPRYLNYAREVLAIYTELDAERIRREPPVQSESTSDS